MLRHLEITRYGRLSVQCLAEFFTAATRRARPLLTPDEAAAQVERLARAWPVFGLTPLIVLEAVRGVREHRLAYWDAQVWATARLNQVPTIVSEDFSSDTVLEGVGFVKPFAPDFVVEAWV